MLDLWFVIGNVRVTQPPTSYTISI